MSPSEPAAGAVHVDRQIRRERARCHPPQTGATGDRTTNDSAPRQRRREASPSDASRVGLLRGPGSQKTQRQKVPQHAPQKGGKLGATVCRRSEP